MSYPSVSIKWFRKINEPGEEPKWSPVGVEITDFIDVKVSEFISDGKKTRTDTFSVVIPNVDVDRDNYGDNITINLASYPPIANDDIIQINFSRDKDGGVIADENVGIIGNSPRLSIDNTQGAEIINVKSVTPGGVKTAFSQVDIVNDDSNFSDPLLLSAGTVEFSRSSGNFNFSSADLGGLSGDTITCSYTWTGAVDTLVMSGKVVDVTHTITVDSRETVISGVNRTQTLLRSMFSIETTKLHIPMLIVRVLEQVNSFNVNHGIGSKIFYIYYNTLTGQYEDQDGNVKTASEATIQRFKRNGITEFPEDTFRSWYENAYGQLQNLSGIDMTQDSNYIFYVDANNNFHWESKDTTTTKTLTEGVDFMGAKPDQDNDAVVNFFVIHCGRNANGSGILTFDYNDESIAEHGASGKFLDRTQMGTQILEYERERNPSSFSTASYPYPTSAALAAGYTFNFVAASNFTVGSTNVPKGSLIQVFNESDYNETVIKQAKSRAKNEASSILSVLGESRWMCNVEFNGTEEFSKGQLVNFVIPSAGWTGSNIISLRVHEITHRFNKNGWSTDIKFAQDEESISTI